MIDFAYDEVPDARYVVDVTVNEGKDCQTLIPIAILRLRLDDDGPQATFKLPLEIAEVLCRKLLTCSAKAREQCWE